MKNVPRNPADSSVGGIGTVPFLCIDCVVLFYSFFAHIAYGSCMIYAFLCAYLTLFSSLYIL